MYLRIREIDCDGEIDIATGAVTVRSRRGYAVIEESNGVSPGREISILCFGCGMRSYNPGDVVHKYCGHCRVFHED